MDLFGEAPAEEPEEIIEEIIDNSDHISPGLLHPRRMNICLGHEATERDLLDLVNSGRIPHGLIFAGQQGIGKSTMAYRFARYLLKSGIADPNQDSLFGEAPAAANTFEINIEDPVFRQVAAGAHPDMLTVERLYDAAKNRYKAGVEVAEIRKVAPFLRMTASGNGYRIALIDDADTMNRSSQNALLKILEEPPKNTVLILVAHRLGELIPTIRSRCRVVHFHPLNQEIIGELLRRQVSALTSRQTTALIGLAEGSLGKALSYTEEGGLEVLDKILAAFQDYPRWNWPELHILADELSRNGREQSFNSFRELLPWIFQQLIRAKARCEAIGIESLQIEPLQGLLRNSSLEHLLKICENLQSHFARLESSNLDKRQGVLSAFSLISA